MVNGDHLMRFFNGISPSGMELKITLPFFTGAIEVDVK